MRKIFKRAGRSQLRLPVLCVLAVSTALTLGLPSVAWANPTSAPGSFVVNNPGLVTYINVTGLGTWNAQCFPASGTGTAGEIGATICTGYGPPLFLDPNAPERMTVTGVTCSFQAYDPGGGGPIISYSEHGTVVYLDGNVTAYCPPGNYTG
jgi:hypothetical protein